MRLNFDGYISVGKFGRPHGIEGWIAVEIYSGYPNRLDEVKVIFTEMHGQLNGSIIADLRLVGKNLQMQLKGVEGREGAKSFAGKEIFLPADDSIELDEGEYFIHDLIGMNVIAEDGAKIGVLNEVMTAGANDVYVVKTGGEEILIPAVAEFIKHIDVEKKEMIVRLWDEM